MQRQKQDKHDRQIDHENKRAKKSKADDLRFLNSYLDRARRIQFSKPWLRKGIACVRKLRFVSGMSAFSPAD